MASYRKDFRYIQLVGLHGKIMSSLFTELGGAVATRVLCRFLLGVHLVFLVEFSSLPSLYICKVSGIRWLQLWEEMD
jgi:hypothetical protein